MGKYTIGVDFGTLSGRAVIVDIADGKEVAFSVFDYPHGVMDENLPDGTRLGHDWALQHPQDYLNALSSTVKDVLRVSGIAPEDVIGIATDFTACTLIPVKKDGTPLCMMDPYHSVPHAYAKLWKHHAAQDKANQLNEIAEKRGETWLARYGGKISSEWVVPKIWQVLDEAPEVYEAADAFVEAADWIVWQLTGTPSRNACTAGYKAIWHKRDGYPGKAFFKSLDPRLENLVEDKLSDPVLPLGARAGGLSEAGALLTGLLPGTSVAVGNVDAHVTVPALKIDGPGKMLAIMGTSTCHILIGNEEKTVPGMCGVVEDGVLGGYYGYEAGQSCVGDHFAWFVDTCVPASYHKEANEKNCSIYELLSAKARKLDSGESGIVALDWWNGNRSVLVDVNLTGVMLGMTLQTRPEEMYRALIEATAFGTRKIIETFEMNGVPVDEFYAAGGISQKDPLIMQIYANVIRKPIRIAGSTQSPALGSAIFAAVAAGEERGGYSSVQEAAREMGSLMDVIYTPDAKNAQIYDQLYEEYSLLHDYFGRGTNDVMKRLKNIKKQVADRKGAFNNEKFE